MDITALMVEDSETERVVISRCLEKEGITVIEAADAEDGLRLAREKKPDVIIMDIVLPGMSGFQAMRKLRGAPETESIPIVVVSTKGEKVDFEWGRRQGANEYLVKPVDCGELIAAVKKVIG